MAGSTSINSRTVRIGEPMGLAALLEAAPERMRFSYVPQENPGEPTGLAARLKAAPERMKALVIDTSKVAVSAALASVKHHVPDFDLLKVAEVVDLEELVEAQDIKAATEEVMKKVDL